MLTMNSHSVLDLNGQTAERSSRSNLARKTALVGWPALAFGGKSRRLVHAGNHCAPEHRRSKPGWFLYNVASAPRPARGEFDLEAEKSLAAHRRSRFASPVSTSTRPYWLGTSPPISGRAAGHHRP
jgi:hypothetical protein